jgi:ERCC4-related helicase
VQYKPDPPKVETLVEALKEITEAGSSALVFTQFLATYDRIRKPLPPQMGVYRGGGGIRPQ